MKLFFSTREIVIAAASLLIGMAIFAAFKIGQQLPVLNVVAAGNYHLHAVLRPDSSGHWFIQNDAGHEPYGVDTKIIQTDHSIRIRFTRTYARVGTIQISSDDDFGGSIAGYASLGTEEANIVIKADGKLIDPKTIWDHAAKPGNGNFWIDITMMDALPSK